jgi:hypothetical protein
MPSPDVLNEAAAEPSDATRMAIGLMTAWLASPDGPPIFVVDELKRHIEGHYSGDRLVAAVELVMGMTHLCGALLVLREIEHGVSGQQSIQTLALHFAESGGLPTDRGDNG